MSSRRRRDFERRSPGRTVARLLLVVVAGAALFTVGVAVGRTTLEHPQPGRRTEVRTLQPRTVAPPARTVTVTVTVPTEG